MRCSISLTAWSRPWLCALLSVGAIHTALAADTLVANKTSPVPVVFGVRALAPDTPINNQVAFVSQEINLPAVTCTVCAAAHTHWETEWLTTGARFLLNDSQPEQGWYVFASGLKGIGFSVKTRATVKAGRVLSGKGNHADLPAALTAGLVRLAQDTGAGLAELPPAQFRRVTVFYDDSGRRLYAQEDTVRLAADLTVPTCTTSAGSLSFQLPDISQVWLKRHVALGEYTDTVASPPQLVVANCSENTRNLRIRFIPAGAVTASTQGPDTILVGRDLTTGQDTGTGYLMKYDAQGFGQDHQGVVQWNRQLPLIVNNPKPAQTGDALNQGVTITLQAFYARAKNNLPVTAGQITAKGMYEVSYD